MTDNYGEGEPGPIVNLDSLDDITARHWRWAVAEAALEPVWITEGGKRIAAVVNKETAEALVRLHNAAPVQDIEELLGPKANEDFGPFIAALKTLRVT